MTNRKSLVVFGLLGGLFGWIWILASIGVLVAIGGALLADWSWWNVLYAFGIGAVSKWLAKGFNDNKQRVLFEQEMIASGMSGEEAGKAWVEAYGRT